MPIYLYMAESSVSQSSEMNPPRRVPVGGAIEYHLDRTAFSVVTMERADEDGLYWASKTFEERMTAIEYLRRMAYGDAATGRLQRVFEVVQRPPA